MKRLSITVWGLAIAAISVLLAVPLKNANAEGELPNFTLIGKPGLDKPPDYSGIVWDVDSVYSKSYCDWSAWLIGSGEDSDECDCLETWCDVTSEPLGWLASATAWTSDPNLGIVGAGAWGTPESYERPEEPWGRARANATQVWQFKVYEEGLVKIELPYSFRDKGFHPYDCVAIAFAYEKNDLLELGLPWQQGVLICNDGKGISGWISIEKDFLEGEMPWFGIRAMASSYVVPEPGAMSLMVFGAVMLCRKRRA